MVHPLGTNYLGKDVLRRMIYGSRTSLIVGLVAIGLAAAVGMTLGLISPFFGSNVYATIMRFIDTFMALPQIMLAIAIASLLGGRLKNIVIPLAVSMIPPYARIMCVQVLSIKENHYFTASHAIGADNLGVMLRHIVPNFFPPTHSTYDHDDGTRNSCRSGPQLPRRRH
jgi:peptide/nickel transport system permease protein